MSVETAAPRCRRGCRRARPGRRTLHRVVDGLRGGLLLELDGEVDERRGGHRDADGEALEPAEQVGDDEADRLGGAGRGRHEVDGGAAGAAVVLVRRVEQALVAGVGVDRRHHAVADAERLVEHLGHGGQAVGGAGGVGDDVVALGVVVGLEVDAERDGDVGVLGRGGDDHLARAGGEVLGGARAVAEEAAGLDDHVGAEGAPGQVGGVGLGEDGDLGAVDADGAVEHLDRAREGAVDRVVAQQVREHLEVHGVVDADPFEVSALLVGGAEHRAPGAAEAVDAEFRVHACTVERAARVPHPLGPRPARP